MIFLEPENPGFREFGIINANEYHARNLHLKGTYVRAYVRTLLWFLKSDNL